MKHNLPPLILANGMKLPAELAEVAVDADRTENKRWRVVFGCSEEMGITDRSRIPRLSFHQAARLYLPVCYFVMRRQDRELEKG